MLQLTPEDVVTVGGKVKFTAAKFNVVGEETLIVTSTANWVIIWNFEDLGIFPQIYFTSIQLSY